MKTHPRFLLAALLPLVLLALAGPAPAAEAGKINVLVLIGGHDFETNQFHQMFQANADITFEVVEHPKAYARLRPDAVKAYDVIVLYDMWQKITPEAKADFVSALKAGKGLVSLHHSIADYQQWPEYEAIVGGKYYLENTVVKGVEKARSTWQHGVMIKVQVADPAHPITRGVQDFTIHDEAYGKYDMAPESHTLLTTENPLCAKKVAWAKTYGPARVAYIQLGHDHYAYEDPNYRRLVANAIRWAAKKD
jgi:type 1 glutamine amidotransferase